MSNAAYRGALVISTPGGRAGLAADARRLRAEAQARYGEVDLLVAVLRDHVRDLQIERDRLRAELESTKARARLESAAWMWRGMKPGR
ncbi:MAG: hypothetical protein C0506_05205 [Anaerolinea sp.]|nr:hypothetical protein [Anaerolinea sp.]